VVGVPGSLVGDGNNAGQRGHLVVMEILLAGAGLVLLTVAADHLVLGASRLARRLRVSPVVVGVIVIGLGTSAPEFLVSGLAAARGDAGLAVGNLVGSNILNVTLILGIAALIAPMPMTSAVLRREAPLATASVLLFAVLAWAGLGVPAAAVLAVAGAAATWVLVVWARDGRGDVALAGDVREYVGETAAAGPPERAAGWVEPARALLGLAGVLAGAQLLVANATAIATSLGVSQVVIGFTLVALGTSLPELVTSVQAQRRGESELVVGNLFGSNLFNSLVGGSLVGFAYGGGTARSGGLLLAAMVLSMGLAWALLRRGLVLTRAEGAVLLLAYLSALPLVLAS
jgi:cation:H+ antiporter